MEEAYRTRKLIQSVSQSNNYALYLSAIQREYLILHGNMIQEEVYFRIRGPKLGRSSRDIYNFGVGYLYSYVQLVVNIAIALRRV